MSAAGTSLAPLRPAPSAAAERERSGAEGTSLVSPRLYAHPTQPEMRVLALPFSRDRRPPSQCRAALKACFDLELAAGKTYPQRGPLSDDEFDAIFLAYDLIIGLLLPASALPPSFSAPAPHQGLPIINVQELNLSLDAVDWSLSLAFGYYIKPNYPGRSSHLCNAGFLIPPSRRGQRLGSLAGRSYIFYGPALGYRGSVFNLVYVSNVASVRIWEALGFERVGRVPHAGLLVVDQGAEGEARKEEYTDAWLIHGDFARLQQKMDEEHPAVEA